MADCIREDGETREEFMERCTLEDDEDACREIWDEYNGGEEHAKPGVMRKTSDKAVAGDPLNFILSDGSIDSYGDVIEPSGWDLKQFKRNPIAFFNHNPSFVVGKWHDVRVSGNALRGRLELAKAGTSDRVNEIRALVEQGILKSVSVGFTAQKHEPIDDKEFGGRRYLKQTLLECSLVSIPANSNALQEQLRVARSMNISRETQELVFGKRAVKKADEKKRPSVQEVMDRRRERERLSAKLKKDSAKLRLVMRIRKQDAWLRTLEKVNDALNRIPSLPLPEADDWNARREYEQEHARQRERGAQRILKIVEQEKKVDQLKQAFKHIYGKEESW